MFFVRLVFLLTFLVPASFSEGLVTVTKQGEHLFVKTIHGDMIVEDSMLIELINSKPFERLKHIRQHGTSDFNHPTRLTYHRYDHSLGVMFMIAKHGGSLKSQAAGLLHDISHTAFSHAADPLYMGSFRKGAYQDKVHPKFLLKWGVAGILKKYDFSVEDMDPEHDQMLDQPSPKLCGDRLEYNLVTGVIDGNFSKRDQECMEAHLFYEEGRWFFDDVEVAKILAMNSLWETENRWGSAQSLLTGVWTSEILAEALRRRIVTVDEIEYDKSDDELWARFAKEGNSYIKTRMKWIADPKKYFDLKPGHKKAMIMHGKYRGINPLIKVNGEFKVLSDIDPEFKKKFEEGKAIAEKGWDIVFKNGARVDMKLT